MVGDDCIRGCGERAEEGVVLLRDRVFAAGPLGRYAYESSMVWPRAVMGGEAAMGVAGEMLGDTCRRAAHWECIGVSFEEGDRGRDGLVVGADPSQRTSGKAMIKN